ncbi:hypothetical protein M3Y99_01733200 [Aphelenchoides fujianensis]|nr:hypothetical protein M3Y99_01733200 [Aphelenchoides fujianensis]
MKANAVKSDSSQQPLSDGGKTPSERSERSPVVKTPNFRARPPGQFLHDAQLGPSDMSLDSYTRRLCAMNVYRVFFDYTTVIMMDQKEAAPTFDKHPQLNRYSDIQCREATRVRVPGQKFAAGPFVLSHAGTRHVRESYDATVLMLSYKDEPARKVLHITFYSWPDKGTPTRPTEVLYLLEDLNFNRKLLMEEAVQRGWLTAAEQSPIVIHCLAGVGRSGALVTLDICARRLEATYSRPSGPLCDVRETYLYVHLAIIEYALRQRLYDNVDAVDLTPFMAASSIQ